MNTRERERRKEGNIVRNRQDIVRHEEHGNVSQEDEDRETYGSEDR